MTVKELITELEKYPAELPVTSEGGDSGGYDVVSGANVYLELRDWGVHAQEHGNPPKSIHIAHQED